MADYPTEDASLPPAAESWPKRRSLSRSPERQPSTTGTEMAGTEMTDTEMTDATESMADPTASDRTSSRATSVQQIRSACIHGDLAELQSLAASEGGLLTDELRQVAWPVLLGLPVDGDGRVDEKAAAAKAGMAVDEGDASWQNLPAHRDEEQVQLDVNRAFVYYPIHASPVEEARQRRALSDLIVEVLRRQPFLCYFQGFHDICQVLLLVLPPGLRTPAVLRLAVLRIRDFMLPTIDAAVTQLQLLPDILQLADRPLWTHLHLAQHPRPFFALGGTLTMYAHDMRSLGAIARVFDVLLARPPDFSLYLFAAIVCAHRSALFATPADEPEMLHHILSRLPGDAGDPVDGETPPGHHLDLLVADAARLADRFPPHVLPAWRAVSAASVLKTAQRPGGIVAQSVADGERLFRTHVRELDRADRHRLRRAHLHKMLIQYRTPLRAVGVAVLVGVLAIWLRRAGPTGTSSATSLGNLLARPFTAAASGLSRLGIRFT
ncbi:tbc domain protein [Grosmannia clavigera kw1407]|uniref:Tbc domain protein n=1 Tax=Grosmannia clavigera (strain kw1407 / UAMH 11150) TaxID=655863 RepID=F0X8Y5_GROCL|nr:tbc domain protein [Grosmannia clavigera kw1407]EFX05625.1 tbc domain protein [Grosmannia clavigera kw1407]